MCSRLRKFIEMAAKCRRNLKFLPRNGREIGNVRREIGNFRREMAAKFGVLAFRGAAKFALFTAINKCPWSTPNFLLNCWLCEHSAISYWVIVELSEVIIWCLLHNISIDQWSIHLHWFWMDVIDFHFWNSLYVQEDSVIAKRVLLHTRLLSKIKLQINI